jgi:hypothetical protein
VNGALGFIRIVGAWRCAASRGKTRDTRHVLVSARIGGPAFGGNRKGYAQAEFFSLTLSGDEAAGSRIGIYGMSRGF